MIPHSTPPWYRLASITYLDYVNAYYDLVVIDESHNFRNNAPGKRDEEGNLIRKSRYERLMDDIIKAGVRQRCCSSLRHR